MAPKIIWLFLTLCFCLEAFSASLFNGQNLSAWDLDEENTHHWTIQNGVLNYDGQGKDLWTRQSFADFVLSLEWRWAGTPKWEDFPVIGRDSYEKKDAQGKPITERVLDGGDSGVFLRGFTKAQANLFCYPCGSGEVWEYRTDLSLPEEIRRAVTPKKKADKPVGEWNKMKITMVGDRLTVQLNGEEVISQARLPGIPARGPIGLQHEHGVIQFRNITVQEFPPTWHKTVDQVYLTTASGQIPLSYQIKLDPSSKISAPSAAYFHPFTTPSGLPVTEVAPADHPHHRGIFLAFLEMHGKKDADFWGWGEHAPVKDRIIETRSAQFSDLGGVLRMRVQNDWVAERVRLLQENLQAEFRQSQDAHILDLQYTLIPDDEIDLPQWSFSGFCARLRKDGDVRAFGPQGFVTLADPLHNDPKTAWPDGAFYGFQMLFPNNQAATVAVFNHPSNPPTLWTVHRNLRMLNPCIVAPGPVHLNKKKPLVLRYRVVTMDGLIPPEKFQEFVGAFVRPPPPKPRTRR